MGVNHWYIIARKLTESELFAAGLGQALAHLGNLGFKIHLLFDEFEQTASNPNLGDPFYDALRSLPTRAENISYVIATRTGLAALQQVYDKVSSPFFNIFTTVTLYPFQEDEVDELILDYFARSGSDFSLAEKLYAQSSFLYEVTGYHPFFLQALCYHFYEGLSKPSWPLGRAREEALLAFEKDAEPHFDYYWQVSSAEERELLGMLATRQPIEWERWGHIARNLQDRCLVVRTESGWRLFSSVFARWIETMVEGYSLALNIGQLDINAEQQVDMGGSSIVDLRSDVWQKVRTVFVPPSNYEEQFKSGFSVREGRVFVVYGPEHAGKFTCAIQLGMDLLEKEQASPPSTTT